MSDDRPDECSNCYNFKRFSTKDTTGFCRKLPPVVDQFDSSDLLGVIAYCLATKLDENDGREEISKLVYDDLFKNRSLAKYPVVEPSDWCGEYNETGRILRPAN